MVEICEGTRTKADMLTESVEQYKEIYMRTKQEFERLVNVSGIVFSLCIGTQTVPVCRPASARQRSHR